MLESINPATGECLERFKEHTKRDIEILLDMAQLAFLGWRNVAVRERGALMKKAAHVLRRNKLNCASIITREMGKPITEARTPQRRGMKRNVASGLFTKSSELKDQ